MIIKGQARGRYRQLATHLLNAKENERIHLYECRGTLAQSVEGALAEMEAQGAQGRSKRPLYHASISPAPDRPLSEVQLCIAVDVLEAKLGFAGQPRLVVTHRKHGREHVHVVWSRIDRTGKAISDGWNYARHEKASRELEEMFGHPRVEGAHGRNEDRPRPGRAPEEYELRQTARSGLASHAVRSEVADAWNASADGEAFKKRIEAAGYRLVRGERRGFVVLDRAGEAHSLARCLGMRSEELEVRMQAVDLRQLPDVRAGRALQRNVHKRATRYKVMVRSFSLSTGPILRGISVRAAFHRSYTVDRSAIIADFASKIAAACADDGSRDEIAARIRRLREEEAAALAALKQASQSSRSSIRMKYRIAAREVTRPREQQGLTKRVRDAAEPG